MVDVPKIIQFISNCIKNGFKGYIQINFPGNGTISFNKFEANLKAEDLIK